MTKEVKAPNVTLDKYAKVNSPLDDIVCDYRALIEREISSNKNNLDELIGTFEKTLGIFLNKSSESMWKGYNIVKNCRRVQTILDQ